MRQIISKQMYRLSIPGAQQQTKNLNLKTTHMTSGKKQLINTASLSRNSTYNYYN